MARVPTQFSETSVPPTESAKARWRWLRIWEFGPTRGTAGREEAFSTLFFRAREMAGRGPIEEINAETQKLVQDWGRASDLTSCTPRPPAAVLDGNRNGN